MEAFLLATSHSATLTPLLVPVAGVIAAALIAGLFALAGRRSTDELEAHKQLVSSHRERADLLKSERDEARAERDAARQEIRALEVIVSEYRATRGVRK